MPMAIQENLYTADDLWELSSLPRHADKRLELIEGVITEVAPSSAIPAIIAARLVCWMGNFAGEHDLGYVVTAGGGFELSARNVLAPDVAFVSRSRVTQLPRRYFQLAPDLAVEVVSPTDSVKATQYKAAKYLAFGTRLVWIVYPGDKTVDVCHPSEQGDMSVQEVGSDGVLEGGDVLPGFSLKVSDLFSGLELSASPLGAAKSFEPSWWPLSLKLRGVARTTLESDAFRRPVAAWTTRWMRDTGGMGVQLPFSGPLPGEAGRPR